LNGICKCGVAQKVHAVCVTIPYKNGLEMQNTSFFMRMAGMFIRFGTVADDDAGAFTMNSMALETLRNYILVS
jgi:hypothetical protein